MGAGLFVPGATINVMLATINVGPRTKKGRGVLFRVSQYYYYNTYYLCSTVLLGDLVIDNRSGRAQRKTPLQVVFLTLGGQYAL